MQTEVEIGSEADYRMAVRVLGQRSRPSWVLRMMMNALERYRQSRKMGWSRPQNKVGLTVFASYGLTPAADEQTVTMAFEAFFAEFEHALTPELRAYVTALRHDPSLMGFLFVHDLVEGENTLEGMTFSFGRRAAGAPRFRDRFDVIVESDVSIRPRRGATRIRAYVDEFKRPIEAHPARVFSRDEPASQACKRLFEHAVHLHGAWSRRADKHWTHWTSDYIDYFAPRPQPVAHTYFPTHVDVLAGMRAVG